MPKGLDLKLNRAYTGSPDHSTILITIFESHKGKYSKYNKYNISLLHCGLQGRNQSLLQPGSGRWKREEGGEEGGEGGEDEDEDEDEVDVLRKNDFGKRDGKKERKKKCFKSKMALKLVYTHSGWIKLRNKFA